MQDRRRDSLEPQDFIPLLTTREFGKEYYYVAETASTNALARSLADEGAPAGTLVVAKTQSGGRGRLGRSWESPPGGIWLSIVLRPPIAPARAPLQTLLAAVALAEALQQVENLECAIKWPNDILSGGKKLAGILTEMKTVQGELSFLVAGIGINANFSSENLPVQIRATAVTLLDLLRRPINRPRFMANFLDIWEKHYHQAVRDGYADILSLWRRHNHTLGRDVRIDTGKEQVTGRAVDIDGSGGLIVETPQGRREIFLAGEVTVLQEKAKEGYGQRPVQ